MVQPVLDQVYQTTVLLLLPVFSSRRIDLRYICPAGILRIDPSCPLVYQGSVLQHILDLHPLLSVFNLTSVLHLVLPSPHQRQAIHLLILPHSPLHILHILHLYLPLLLLICLVNILPTLLLKHSQMMNLNPRFLNRLHLQKPTSPQKKLNTWRKHQLSLKLQNYQRVRVVLLETLRTTPLSLQRKR